MICTCVIIWSLLAFVQIDLFKISFQYLFKFILFFIFDGLTPTEWAENKLIVSIQHKINRKIYSSMEQMFAN